MVNFKDLLSSKSSTSLVSLIGRGEIVRMKLTQQEGITPKNDGDVDRNKYFVVLGRTDDGSIIGFSVINSNINEHLPMELQQLHYPIKKSDYPFLKHDSFIYCGQLKEIKTSVFAERYQSETFGKLHESDLNLVLGALLSSPLETRKHLKRFGII